MRFSFIEWVLGVATAISLCLVLICAIYDDATSEKITLIKKDWVCTDTESKTVIISGKAYPRSECVEYSKER